MSDNTRFWVRFVLAAICFLAGTWALGSATMATDGPPPGLVVAAVVFLVLAIKFGLDAYSLYPDEQEEDEPSLVRWRQQDELQRQAYTRGNRPTTRPVRCMAIADGEPTQRVFPHD